MCRRIVELFNPYHLGLILKMKEGTPFAALYKVKSSYFPDENILSCYCIFVNKDSVYSHQV